MNNKNLLITIYVPILHKEVDVWVPYENSISSYLPALVLLVNQDNLLGLLDVNSVILYDEMNKIALIEKEKSLKDYQIVFGKRLLLL